MATLKREPKGIRYSCSSSYHNESWVKFITGDLDVDADWDEYVATLERMGPERMLEIAQKVFDRQYG